MSYKTLLENFIEYPWERECEISFVEKLTEYSDDFEELSEYFIRENIRKIYEDNLEDLIDYASIEFIEFAESLI